MTKVDTDGDHLPGATVLHFGGASVMLSGVTGLTDWSDLLA